MTEKKKVESVVVDNETGKEVETEKTTPKCPSVADIEAKIKSHKNLLNQITDEGKKVNERRIALTEQLNKIISDSRQLLGAIGALQELLNESKGSD